MLRPRLAPHPSPSVGRALARRRWLVVGSPPAVAGAAPAAPPVVGPAAYVPPVDGRRRRPLPAAGRRPTGRATGASTYVTDAGSPVVRRRPTARSSFAGPVAGALHVTRAAPRRPPHDATRSSPPSTVARRATRSSRASRSASPATRFHFGARDGDGTYLDPDDRCSAADRRGRTSVAGPDEGGPPLTGTADRLERRRALGAVGRGGGRHGPSAREPAVSARAVGHDGRWPRPRAVSLAA